MSTSTALRLNLADYNRMIAEDGFRALGRRRIELICGELRELSPPSPIHAEIVSRVLRWSAARLSDDLTRIWIQDPIEIPELDSAPQLDIVWAKPKAYNRRHPQARDILLLIEVADSSLSEDLGEMAELYAKAGIKDYWVVNIPDFAVEVFRRPKGNRYLEHHTYQAGQEISPLAFPRVSLLTSGLFSGTL